MLLSPGVQPSHPTLALRVMELLRAYSTLPPPPPPPPPGLTRIPDVKRRKTVEGGQGGDSAPFNVFGSPEEDWVEGGKKKGREMFQRSADFDLWASALGGASGELVKDRLACILGSENCFRLLTVLDSGRAELSPPAFMASWGLREYVMLQAVVNSRLGARLTEVVKAIDAWKKNKWRFGSDAEQLFGNRLLVKLCVI